MKQGRPSEHGVEVKVRRVAACGFFSVLSIFRLFVLLFALLVRPAVVLANANLWIADSGRDNWPGTARQPLATIQAALSRAPRGHIKITPGTYRLSTPLILDARNAGLIMEGSGRGETILSGAAATTSIERVTPNVWRSKASMPVFRVWIDGKTVPMGGVPALGWHYIKEPTLNERDPVSHDIVDLSHRAFHPEPAAIAVLAGLRAEELAGVVVTLWHSWEISKHHIERIAVDRNMIYLTDDTPWAIHEFGNVQRYRLDNVPGLLDASGTWYGSGGNWIYYHAAPGQDANRTALVASGLSHLVEIHGTAGITIRNIRFSFSSVGLDPGHFKSNQAASSVDAAIMLDDARRIRLERVTISHTGGYGIWFRHNCRDSIVRESLLEDLGGGGVRIGETETGPPLGHETSGIVVDNNIIRGGGRLYPSAVAVLIGLSGGNRVTHNEIHDFYYSGISVGWKWEYGASPATNNLIEENHVHRIGQAQLSDLAGIYTLGESPGTVVRANVIHDVTGYPGGSGAWGLFADQASSGVLFENNLVFDTTSGGFHENFGKENVVRGNVFAFGRDGQVELTKAEAHNSLTLWGNAVVSDGATFFQGDWKRATARIDQNVYFDVSDRPPTWLSLNFAGWQQLGFDRNSVYTDPGFIDAAKGNYRLKSGSVWSWNGRSPIGVAGVYGAARWSALAREGGN